MKLTPAGPPDAFLARRPSGDPHRPTSEAACMGILDTASEVELIICLALTNPELVGPRDGMVIPLTEEAEAAAGKFTSEVDGQQYYYELTPVGLERWVNDAMEEQLSGKAGTLPYKILQALKEQCGTRMQSLIVPEGSPRGLLLSTERLLKAWDTIRDLVVDEHKLAWKVVPRLSVGVWALRSSNGRGPMVYRVAEPNVTIRISHPDTAAGKEQPVGRKIIKAVTTVAQTRLLQDSIGVRARTVNSDWSFLLAPGDTVGSIEKSVSLFSGTRASAERVIPVINAIFGDEKLAAESFTFEIRPVDRTEDEAAHMLMVRHAGSVLSDFMGRLFVKHADSNRSVASGGVEREYYLPLAHHCPQDWEAHEDLKCVSSANAQCRRWSVRYRFVRKVAPPPSVHGCHCKDETHLLGTGDEPEGCTCVQVRLDCCTEETCTAPRRGTTRWVPACPEDNDEETHTWMRTNWALDWLDLL